MKLITLFAFFTLAYPVISFSQIDDIFITASGNLYLQVNHEKNQGNFLNKDTFPILGYDKGTDPKLLIGGFGVGLSMFKHVNDNLNLKGHVNFTRSVFWESYVVNTGPDPNDPIAMISASSIDYSVGVVVTAHYLITPKFSAGTGLGACVVDF